MKKIFTLFVFALLLTNISTSQTTMAKWTFETSVPVTGGPLTPELGSGSATSNTAGTFSNPSGNGSVESWSSNNWNVGEYYQFQFSTSGYLDLTFSFDQISSTTGPKDFKVQYSTDGSSFTDVSGGAYVVIANSAPNAWSSSTPVVGVSSYSFDLTTVAALENQAAVYIRLVNTSTLTPSGGTVAATGTDRVDNVHASVAAALPVELASFTAIAKGNAVELAWKTASEKNNAGFEIERNVNGSWNKIGYVEGNGTTNAPKSYSYTDASAKGTVSYRLKQVDNDGKFEYSNVVEVAAGITAADYQLSQNFPNPFNPNTNITFAMKNAEHVNVSVYNALGQVVATLFNDVAAANQIYTLNFDGKNLSSGTYFYALKSATRNEVRKMSLMK